MKRLLVVLGMLLSVQGSLADQDGPIWNGVPASGAPIQRVCDQSPVQAYCPQPGLPSPNWPPQGRYGWGFTGEGGYADQNYSLIYPRKSGKFMIVGDRFSERYLFAANRIPRTDPYGALTDSTIYIINAETHPGLLFGSTTPLTDGFVPRMQFFGDAFGMPQLINMFSYGDTSGDVSGISLAAGGGTKGSPTALPSGRGAGAIFWDCQTGTGPNDYAPMGFLTMKTTDTCSPTSTGGEFLVQLHEFDSTTDHNLSYQCDSNYCTMGFDYGSIQMPHAQSSTLRLATGSFTQTMDPAAGTVCNSGSTNCFPYAGLVNAAAGTVLGNPLSIGGPVTSITATPGTYYPLAELGDGTIGFAATPLGSGTLGDYVRSVTTAHALTGSCSSVSCDLPLDLATSPAAAPTVVGTGRTLTGTDPMTIDGDNSAHDLSADRTVAIKTATDTQIGAISAADHKRYSFAATAVIMKSFGGL